MESIGRFFLCAGCRVQVLICSHCDRGQIYCADTCAPRARRASMRAAGQRYQSSRRGRFKHAERSRRYRARQKKVTHQASPAPVPDDLLAISAMSQAQGAAKAIPLVLWAWICHFCGRPCSAFVRIGPLRSRIRRDIRRTERRGTKRDYSP